MKKKIFLYAFTLAIVLCCSLNILYADLIELKKQNKEEENIASNLLSQVDITCGQNEGRCWDGYCKHELGIFGLPMGYMVCDDFKGNMMYSCVNDTPC